MNSRIFYLKFWVKIRRVELWTVFGYALLLNVFKVDILQTALMLIFPLQAAAAGHQTVRVEQRTGPQEPEDPQPHWHVQDQVWSRWFEKAHQGHHRWLGGGWQAEEGGVQEVSPLPDMSNTIEGDIDIDFLGVLTIDIKLATSE